MDRDTVIKGLEPIIGCAKQEKWGAWIDTLEDALALLKEQDAVEPRTEPSAKGYWYTCGACGWWMFQVCDTAHFDDRKRIHFCASCGRKVKWDA